MKKLFLLLAFSGIFNSSAQEKILRCFTTEEHQKNIQGNPQFEKNLADLEIFTRQYIKNVQVERRGSVQIYIIPVVFHILHQYGPENISDAQVIDAVNLLTRDFRKLNPDTVDIVSIFKPIAADCEIEFRLAKIDPNGNCTNGIDRIVTNKTFNADDNSKLNPWPNNKYLNIWTANSLANVSAAAYAHLPGGSNSTDGIMSLSNYVGSIGTSAPYKSRTLTHEIAHYLNLLHVWGISNSPGFSCGDDGIADTPISKGWTTCDTAGSVCNPPIIENVQNYMEYSGCEIMFTQGQKTHMHATLNSSTSGRNNLWTPANLTATGLDGSPITICAPVADFNVSQLYVCAGNPVNFFDLSWNAPVTGWSWSFPGGNPSTSIDSSPSVIYSAAGIYGATLIVTNAGGSDTITKIAIVRASDTAVRAMPFTEDFEDTASFPGIDGWVVNPDNSLSGTWTRVSNANFTVSGTHSIKMNNFINTVGEKDSWITPSIDFSNVGFPINVTFRVANAQRTVTSNDELKFFYSINCGETWSGTSYNKSGSALSTSGISASDYIPTNASQWRLENVNVNPVQNKPNVRFKFQNTSDNGNNIYIDDINITGNITAIDETDELQTGFALYPNPSNGESTISFGLNKSSLVAIDVKNVLGQTVLTSGDQNMAAGFNEYKLPVFSAGIYFVDVMVNNKHHIRKLIVS